MLTGLFAAGLLAATWATPATAATAATPVNVRVSRAVVSRPIAPGFVGFSFEFPAVRAYAGTNPRAINPVLVRLIRNLAPDQAPVLRIGGNSTDDSWWPLPGVTPPPGITFSLDRNWLATTRALATQTGARLILGVNLKLDSLAEAAAEARAYRTGIGTRLIDALEIGNEPELYPVFPWYLDAAGAPFYARARPFGFSSYEQEVKAIARRLGRLGLAGPATGTPSWLSRTAALFAAEPHLNLVTYHRYPLLACFTKPGDPRYPTVESLLSADSARDLLPDTGPVIALAHGRGATFRLDELNSVACRGQAGVSDTFASALWMLDTLFAVARAGVDGVNIHTLPGAAYAPFVFRRVRGRWLATVRPEYYGLEAFTQAAPAGSRLLASAAPSASEVRVRATITPAGLIHVVLINPSETAGQLLRLHVPPGLDPTTMLERLEAPSAAATEGVTLGGQTYGNETGTGLLKGRLGAVRLRPVHGAYLIRLPAASAALLTFTPAAAGSRPGPRTGARR